MRKVLIWASTADPEILRQCPGEQIRYETMGAAILTTASIAAVSAAFAASMALRLWAVVALVVGVGWGLAILNIDRLLVGGVHRRDTVKGNIAAAIPRVILALLIGAVVSTPLVLRIFNGEINAQLDLDHQADLAAFTKSLDSDPRYAQIPSLTQKVQQLQQVVDNGPADNVDQDPTVARLQSEYDQLYTQYQQAEHNVICENEGTCGSGKVGKGPAYDEKVKVRNRLQRDLDAKKAELESARRAATSKQSADSTKVRADAEADLKAAKDQLAGLVADRKADQDAYTAHAKVDRGLLARLQALDHLRSNNSTLGLAYLTLLALLAALEMLPVIAKLMTSLGSPSTYDRIRVDTEAADYLVAMASSAVRTQVAVDTRQARVDAERKQVTRQEQRIAEAQQKVFDAVLDQWTERELHKVDTDVDAYLVQPVATPPRTEPHPTHTPTPPLIFIPQQPAPEAP
jgi:hypothetical protein